MHLRSAAINDFLPDQVERANVLDLQSYSRSHLDSSPEPYVPSPTPRPRRSSSYSSSSDASPEAESESDNQENSQSPIGAIVGGAIGGIVVLVVLLLVGIRVTRNPTQRPDSSQTPPGNIVNAGAGTGQGPSGGTEVLGGPVSKFQQGESSDVEPVEGKQNWAGNCGKASDPYYSDPSYSNAPPMSAPLPPAKHITPPMPSYPAGASSVPPGATLPSSAYSEPVKDFGTPAYDPNYGVNPGGPSMKMPSSQPLSVPSTHPHGYGQESFPPPAPSAIPLPLPPPPPPPPPPPSEAAPQYPEGGTSYPYGFTTYDPYEVSRTNPEKPAKSPP